MPQVDRYADLQRQGFMRGVAKRVAAKDRASEARQVSDSQFRESIRLDCARRQQARWDAIEAGISPDDLA